MSKHVKVYDMDDPRISLQVEISLQGDKQINGVYLEIENEASGLALWLVVTPDDWQKIVEAMK